MPYRLSPLAEQDLDELWVFVAEEAGLSTADRLIDDPVDRFELLAEQSRMGRLRPEFGEGVRSFAVENHVDLLPARERGVDRQVLHGRRDQPRRGSSPIDDGGIPVDWVAVHAHQVVPR